MPLSSSLSPEFLLWAASKVQPLVDARRIDVLHQCYRLPRLNSLLTTIMVEYGNEPFAQPDYVGNLDPNGNVRHTFGYLHERALRFFCNQAAPGGLCPYERPDVTGDGLPLNPSDPCDLWAVTERARLRALTCSALGIAVDTADAHLPVGFREHFQSLVQVQFDLLDTTDRNEWLNLASQSQRALKRGMFDMIDIQRRQLEYVKWMKKLLETEVGIAALGTTFFVGFECFWTAALTRRAKAARAQVCTYEEAENWSKIPNYETNIAPHWEAFMREELEGLDLIDLPPLEPGLPLGELLKFRDILELYLEELFRFQVNSETVNEEVFWRDVAGHPTAFVSCERLPAGISFGNPQDMPAEEFRAFYQHIWDCQCKDTDVHPDRRFAFEPQVIRAYCAIDLAHRLRVQQLERQQAREQRLLGTPSGGDTVSQPSADCDSAKAAAVDADGVPGKDDGRTTRSVDAVVVTSVSGCRIDSVTGGDTAPVDAGADFETQGWSM